MAKSTEPFILIVEDDSGQAALIQAASETVHRPSTVVRDVYPVGAVLDRSR